MAIIEDIIKSINSNKLINNYVGFFMEKNDIIEEYKIKKF